MAATYITKEGDTADSIAWNYYGDDAVKAAERLLEANPGLADYGPELLAGITITLPVIATTATNEGGLKLWD